MDVEWMVESQGASGSRLPQPVLFLATGAALQPLERHLMEQSRAGPELLALAGSDQGPGKWRPEEDQSDEARA